MQTIMLRVALRTGRRAAGALAASSLVLAGIAGVTGIAHAQTPAAQTAPAAEAAQLAPPAVDPSFSAWTLAQMCQQNDAVAQGQCVGAVRGIIHGYQYGVLFLAQESSPPAGEMQRISLCLRDVPVSTIVQEFVADAGQVNPDALKATPAEVALLGSVHSRHACT